MRVFLASIIFLFFATDSFAQDSLLVHNRQPAVIRASILAPGLALEAALGLRTSVYMQAGIALGYQNVSRPHFTTPGVVFVQPRYFYNYKKRLEAGKKTAGFASNYIGLRGSINGSFIKGEGKDIYGLHLTWGPQRNIGKRGYFYIDAGPFLTSNSFTRNISFSPIGFFTGLGIRLGKL